MNWNISAWSIRTPVPSLVLFMVLMTLGYVSFGQLSVTRFPNIDLPIVQVRVYQSGAAPSELEVQVTKKIEDAIAGVNGVKHQTSAVTEGSSITTIEFRLEVNQDRALNDVKDAIARIRAELPRTIDEPIITRIEIEGLPIVTYGARAPGMTPEELSWFVDDVVVRALQGVKAVSQIERFGGVDREIRVSLDPDRLLAFGITAGDVNRQLRATNVDLAGGRGEIAGREQAIRTLAGKQSVADLAATAIVLPRGRKVRLDELGSVTDSTAEPRTFAALDGRPVVAFAISRAKGASDVVVAADVAKKIAELQKAHPNVELKLIDSMVVYTLGAYHSTMKTLIEGAILAIAVVFIFLRDWRATLIAAIALPLSVVPAFWAVDAAGFSLNLVSLLAITIVTGILVDDAIVEIENIVRHMRMGKSPYRAALEAADEIGLAVIAITFTIIAVFVPVSFMGGIAGQYFKQFGLVVAFAVLFSLLVARLITPLLAAYFLRTSHHEDKEGWMLRAYTRLVRWSVAHHYKSVALGLLIFAGSIGSFYLLPSGFLPAEDSGRLLLAVELSPGSRMDETRAVADAIAAQVRERPEVRSVFVNGGRVMGAGAEVRKATLVINLEPKENRKLTQDEVRLAIGSRLTNMADIRFWFLKDNGQRQLQLVASGRNGTDVSRVAAGLTSQAKRIPLLANVVSTAELDRPELRVVPITDVAAELGVSTEAISEAVRIATIGDIGANLAKFDVGERQVPIRVQLEESARGEERFLESLKVATGAGAAVPLSAVARFELAQGPTAIDRYDRMRRVVIGADLVGDVALGKAVERVMALPAAKTLPAGVEIKQFGDAEIMGEVFESFAKAMGAGIMMVFAVLVLLFGSFLQPITILFSLPLSIGGAIVALAVTGRPISLPVVIGILMLMGIVTKNAIMLVDFAVEQMKRGMPRTDAIVDAGRKRARPIVMTTIAMIGGMLPSAYGVGSGGEFRSPMAIAVIGGLMSSTLLSLVFVPAVFSVMDDIAKLGWRIFSRFIGPTEEPPAPVPVAPPPPRPTPGPWRRNSAIPSNLVVSLPACATGVCSHARGGCAAACSVLCPNPGMGRGRRGGAVGMSWLWAVFTVAASGGQVLRNAMQKELTATLGTVGATHVRFLFGLPFALVFLAIVLAATGVPVPEFNSVMIAWTVTGAVTQIAATALLLAVMQQRSFVVTTAYVKTEPVQVAVFGLIFLGEHITPALALAILIATAGVLIVSWPRSNAAEVFSWKAAGLGLASGALFAAAAIGYRGGILALECPSFVVAATTTLVFGLVIQVVMLSAYLVLADRATLVALCRAWKPSLFAGFMGAFASQMWFLAFALETAAKVRTLALVEILFAQLVSRNLFKQSLASREAAGIGLIILGVVLLLNQ